MTNFERDLTEVIYKYSMENESGTPDFILAAYLIDCLAAFSKAMVWRHNWYGSSPKPAKKEEINRAIIG